jgi:hypothetical protein
MVLSPLGHLRARLIVVYRALLETHACLPRFALLETHACLPRFALLETHTFGLPRFALLETQ